MEKTYLVVLRVNGKTIIEEVTSINMVQLVAASDRKNIFCRIIKLRGV